MPKQIRVRFAPAPTGYLHIGSARTALFNWLFARRHGGDFILRIEDTDEARSTSVYEEDISSGLRWLGLDWDEGPDTAGACGPYRQSERDSFYLEQAGRLLQSGEAYYCFCSEEELTERREAALAAGQTPRYDNRCRRIAPPEAAERISRGERPAVRFRTEARTCVVEDMIKGPVSFDMEETGDFIIMKSGDKPAFIFAGVVDDALMGISHVIRGEDHLSNTPRQLLLYQALGFKPPSFAHLPLILGPDRSKLSKRHGATSVIQYREEGYLSEALFNHLLLLGWSAAEQENDIISREQAVDSFSLERISASPAIFDMDKLRWLNGQYIRSLPPERLLDLALPHLRKAGLIPGDPGQFTEDWLCQAVELGRGSVSDLSGIPGEIDFLFVAEPRLEADAEELLGQEEARQVIRAFRDILVKEDEFGYDIIAACLAELSRETGLKKGRIFRPLRAALTGRLHGPELLKIIFLLGRDRTLKRLSASF